MNYEQAETIFKEHIKQSDLTTFKDFDFYYDKSWSGTYYDDFLLEGEEETYLYFDGHISFSIGDDGEVSEVTIEDFETFEHFDGYGDTITKFN